MKEPRWIRQERLKEVGSLGQAKLIALQAELYADDCSLVELVYLCRAGVSHLSVSSAGVAVPCPHEAVFSTEGARQLGVGSWRALRRMRAALGVGIGASLALSSTAPNLPNSDRHGDSQGESTGSTTPQRPHAV